MNISWNKVDNIIFEKQLFGKFLIKALFVAGDPFIAEKATETWQKYESILRKEMSVSEKYFSSLPEDQRTWLPSPCMASSQAFLVNAFR